MLSNQYLTLAYVVGLGLLWGYAITLWLAGRSKTRAREVRGFDVITGGSKS